MNRIVCFIDGFNIYHSIDENPALRVYKWLDLKQLLCHFLDRRNILDIVYFTALCRWDNKKRNRHKVYIRALRNSGITVMKGRFRQVTKKCRKCYNDYQTYEEKRTDVNIAVEMLKRAYKDQYDTAVLVSGDTDLIPAIIAIKELFPKKKIGSIFPINREHAEIKEKVHFYMNIKPVHLRKSVFPHNIKLKDGTVISCPDEWF